MADHALLILREADINRPRVLKPETEWRVRREEGDVMDDRHTRKRGRRGRSVKPFYRPFVNENEISWLDSSLPSCCAEERWVLSATPRRRFSVREESPEVVSFSDNGGK